MVTDADGVEWVAYTPAEGKRLAHLLEDYHALWAYVLSIDEDVRSFKVEVGAWSGRLKTCKSLKVDHKRRADLFRAMFKAERAARLDNERRAALTQWIPWGLVIVESVLFGVVGVYAASQ